MEKYIRKINYYETDKMGITHHSNYVKIMEEARIHLLEQLGFGYERFEKDGVISPVLNITCDYKKSTTFNDVLEIQVKVQKLSAIKVVFEYEFYLQNEIVFTATSTHCFFEISGKPVFLEKTYPDFYSKLESLK